MQAREFQELAKTEALNAARDMVQEKRSVIFAIERLILTVFDRSTSQNHDTVDLHGTTVAEAIVIIKEILKNEGSSISQGRLSSSIFHTRPLSIVLFYQYRSSFWPLPCESSFSLDQIL